MDADAPSDVLDKPPWHGMDRVEKRAAAASAVLTLAGVLAGPHILCWLAGRELASGVATLLLDALVIELVGVFMLVLWPVKMALKKWLYAEEGEQQGATKTAKWVVAGVWVVGVVLLLAALMPQAFFFLTGRALASGPKMWVFDTLSAAAALVPQILGTMPWVWAANRMVLRQATEKDDGAAHFSP